MAKWGEKGVGNRGRKVATVVVIDRGHREINFYRTSRWRTMDSNEYEVRLIPGADLTEERTRVLGVS